MAKKKNSKKAVVVLRAPKAVKRGNRGNTRHSDGGQQLLRSRAVISNSTMRPYFKINSGSDSVTVSGMELMPSITAQLSTTSGESISNFYLNPGNTQFFKRLSTVSMGFQKFRFRSLRLKYCTTCASSSTGTLSAAVLLDPLESAPQSPQEFLGYAHSLVTAVSLDAVSLPRKIVDPRWYLCDTGDSAPGLVDPTTRFQGNVVWMTSDVESSTARRVGYLALEYVCEFTGHRPLRDSSLSLSPNLSTTYTGGASATANALKYDGITSQVGSFDLDADTRQGGSTGYPVGNYPAQVTRNDSWTDMLFRHALNYYLPLTAATLPDGLKVSDEKGFIPRPTFSATRSRPGDPLRLFVGCAPVDTVPNWITVQAIDSENEGKSGVLAHPVRAKDLRHDCEYRFQGNAAGDVTIAINSASPGTSGTVTVIDSTTYSSGAGAITPSKSIYWGGTIAGTSRIYLSLVPTGVENRQVLNDGVHLPTVSDVALNGNRALG